MLTWEISVFNITGASYVYCTVHTDQDQYLTVIYQSNPNPTALVCRNEMIEERLITCETYGASTNIIVLREKKGGSHTGLYYSYKIKAKKTPKKQMGSCFIGDINECICKFQCEIECDTNIFFKP